MANLGEVRAQLDNVVVLCEQWQATVEAADEISKQIREGLASAMGPEAPADQSSTLLMLDAQTHVYEATRLVQQVKENSERFSAGIRKALEGPL